MARKPWRLEGAGAIVGEGETVFIKPNFGAFGMVNYNPVISGDSTKPEIVIAVAEECLKAGAAEVIIGDAGQAKRYDWGGISFLDGSTTMAAEAARLDEQPGQGHARLSERRFTRLDAGTLALH